MLQTKTLELYAGIPVANYAVSLEWYQRLLGAPPTFVATEIEAGWVLAEQRTVYIEQRPEHAGHAMQTIIVDDLNSVIAQIAERGIDFVEQETYENGWRKVIYRDPDGNEFGVGGAPA